MPSDASNFNQCLSLPHRHAYHSEAPGCEVACAFCTGDISHFPRRRQMLHARRTKERSHEHGSTRSIETLQSK